MVLIFFFFFSLSLSLSLGYKLDFYVLTQDLLPCLRHQSSK